jgi:hypothetical protein
MNLSKFDVIFADKKTGRVNYAVQTRFVLYVTMSEVGYVTLDGRKTSCPFTQTEKLEIVRT